MAIPSIAVIDSLDSFTFNIVHYLESVTGKTPVVIRNSESIDKVKDFDALILSPGPGLPKQAGNLMEFIKHYAASKKILGICLGHQAIGQSFGAKLTNLPDVLHGVSRTVYQENNHKIFYQLPESFTTGHYHSWIISRENFPEDFEIIARDESGNIMGIAHRKLDVCGIQFHPESVLTPAGFKMLNNWIHS